MDGPRDGHLGDMGDGSWSQAFPWLARTAGGQKLRSSLERAEAAHRTSAALMRAMGREDRARRAEQFAAWTRLELDEPETAHLLYAAVKDLRYVKKLGPLLDRALEAALSLLGSGRGNIQVLDPVTGTLRVACSRGFGTEFLDHFAVVADDGSACGRAAALRAQTVIADVRTDPGFAPHRHIAAAAGFRAVQSTPLTDARGRLLGMVSTHYPRPYCPPDRDLLLIERFGDMVGAIMAGRLRAFPDGLAGDPFGWSVAARYKREPVQGGAGPVAQPTGDRGSAC